MKRVLIIEDELMIADMLEEILVEDGFAVCGIASHVKKALQLAEQYRPELAIVDVHLVDGLGTEIAPTLMARYCTGILYTTANPEAINRAAGHACLLKPFRIHQISKALETVAAIVETGQVPPTTDDLIILSRFDATTV
jgi:response regulator of citrate/malate metabolism